MSKYYTIVKVENDDGKESDYESLISFNEDEKFFEDIIGGASKFSDTSSEASSDSYISDTSDEEPDIYEYASSESLSEASEELNSKFIEDVEDSSSESEGESPFIEKQSPPEDKPIKQKLLNIIEKL